MTRRAVKIFSPVWFTPASEIAALLDIDQAAAAELKGDELDAALESVTEPPTRFKVRGLDGSQQAEVMPDCLMVSDDDIRITAPAMYKIIKYGLVDWENFDDADGGPVRFSKNAKANQARLEYSDQVEIAGKVLELTFETAEDKKK